jgi:hypothetical protein
VRIDTVALVMQGHVRDGLGFDGAAFPITLGRLNG